MEELNHNQEDSSSVIKSIMVEQEEKTREALDPLVVVIGAVNSLKDREREVLLGRFGLEDGNKMTLETIGSKFGVTRERARQIESSAIKKLAEKPTKDLAKLLKITNSYLAEMGGVVSLLGLADYFKIGNDQRREATLNALRLTMALDTNVVGLAKEDNLRIGWAKKSATVGLLNKVLVELEKILAGIGKPVKEEVLWEELTKSTVYAENSGRLTPSILHGILLVGAKLARTDAGEWGLVMWPTVVPKRIRDKIFLILQKTGKPMHFREIADAINQAFPGKTVLSRTVHNELIGDARFVLVGRGIYGLKEQGYQPGVVVDVIVKVMKQANRPLTAEEIINAVLKDRQVKRNTVIANLQNKKLFKKVDKGSYVLRGEAEII